MVHLSDAVCTVPGLAAVAIPGAVYAALTVRLSYALPLSQDPANSAHPPRIGPEWLVGLPGSSLNHYHLRPGAGLLCNRTTDFVAIGAITMTVHHAQSADRESA